MHIVGIAKHKDGRTFYLTKDSYGIRGSFAGHRMISRNYLMAKMLSFMVHVDGIDSKLKRTDVFKIFIRWLLAVSLGNSKVFCRIATIACSLTLVCVMT